MTDAIPMVIPVVNRFDMFTEMMETVDTPIVPFVIDQWRGNRGVSAAWNLGMQRVLDAGYTHTFICNDDLKFTPGAIRGVYEALIDTGAALISPNQMRLPKRSEVYVNDGIRTGADFFCFAVDIEQLTQTAGWFDENFFPAYFEDNDMHWRMIKSGLVSYIHTDHTVIHEGSMTQKFDRKRPVTDGIRFEANKDYFKRKWGEVPQKTTWATPFNHPELTVRDWNGSLAYDGLESSHAQTILNEVDSVAERTKSLGGFIPLEFHTY